MEEKKSNAISVSAFFLIIAIIVIIAMGYFIYKLNNDKKAELQKSTELQAQVNSLNGTVSNLQGKIDSMSETISSNEENQNNIENNKTSADNDNTTETDNSTNINTSPYDKYKNEKDEYGPLEWLVKERLGNNNIDQEHFVYGEDLNEYCPFLDLKNGKLYHIPENENTMDVIPVYESTKKTEIDTVKGNIKFVFLIDEQRTYAYGSFYVITEDGSLWKNEVNYDSNYNSFSLVKKFDNPIIDITFVRKKDNEVNEFELSITAYYLLANGELLDQYGNAYKTN